MSAPGTDPADLDGFAARVRAWLDEAEIPGVAEDLDVRFAELRAWQGELYRAGLVGLNWPRDWGGQGLTTTHQLVLGRELAARRAPQPIGLIGLDVVGPSIGRFGTSEQRERLLPRLLSGDDIWCQGFSEPGAGSDLAAISTRAVRDGDEFVVDGQKVWTSWGHYAQWCALLVRTEAGSSRHHGLSYLLVPMDRPGVSPRPIRQMTGESEFSEVFFDAVRVPAANLVGELGQGWHIAMDTLSHERGTFGLRRYLEVSTALADALDPVRRADPSLPESLLEQVGRARVAEAVLRAQVHATLARSAAGVTAPGQDSLDKLVLGWAEQEVFGALRELAGPLLNDRTASPWGLTAGTVARDYLYGRASSIYGGSREIQRNIVAERLLGLPRG